MKPERPNKSFDVNLEQTAQLLRSEAKRANQKYQVEKASSGSLANTVEQVAKLIRDQIHPPLKSLTKRTWSKK